MFLCFYVDSLTSNFIFYGTIHSKKISVSQDVNSWMAEKIALAIIKPYSLYIIAKNGTIKTNQEQLLTLT